MEGLITIESILTRFEELTQKNIPITPATWLDGAQRVNALFGNLDDQVIQAEMEVNREQARLVKSGESAAASKAVARASDYYQQYLKAKARREQAIEFIRIAKKRTEQPRWDK